jgi:LPXTG-motif cell wall-anchored protein
MRGWKSARWAAAVVVMAATVVVMAGSGVGAQQADCTDVTVSPSVDLVTRGVSTIGPIQVNVAAGRYRLIMTSADPGHVAGHQTEQQHESWSFTLDNGFSSPITPDLSDELTSATYDMGVADLSVASSITFVHHGVAPSPDSVHPTVTFRCEAAPATTTTASTTAPPPTVADVSTTVAPETTVVQTTAVETTTAAPATTVPDGTVKNNELPRTGSNESVLWMGLLLLTVGGVFLVIGKIVGLEHSGSTA